MFIVYYPKLKTYDFNYPNIDWSTFSGYNLHTFSFCDLIFDLNLVQLIETPTHIAGNTLDLLLTNNDSVIQNLLVNSTLPLTFLSSDHYLVLSVLSPFHLTLKSQNYDWEGMVQFLTHYDFNLIYTLFDINTKWEFLKGVILEATSKFVPTSKLKPQHRPKWFNSEIQHKLNCIHTLRRKTKARPSPQNISKLEAAEQNLSTTMENAKHSYKASLIHNFSFTKSNFSLAPRQYHFHFR